MNTSRCRQWGSTQFTEWCERIYLVIPIVYERSLLIKCLHLVCTPWGFLLWAALSICETSWFSLRKTRSLNPKYSIWKLWSKLIRNFFGPARGSRVSLVDLAWMEISNVESMLTVRSDLTGEIIWQKIRPILLGETLDIIPSAQLDTQLVLDFFKDFWDFWRI